MTLIEVIVAGGLVAGLAVAGLTMFKTVERNFEITVAMVDIHGIMVDQMSSKNNLGRLDSVNAPGIRIYSDEKKKTDLQEAKIQNLLRRQEVTMNEMLANKKK